MMQEYTFNSMTTEVHLFADGTPQRVNQGFAAVRAWIEACAQRFTRFTKTSELAEVNRSEGRWVPVSAEMFELLSQAQELVEQTNGLFDPAVLPELIRAGYKRSIEEIRTQDGVDEAAAAHTPQPHLSFSLASLNAKTRSVHLQPGMALDLGGIAKGWMAEKAAYRLAAYAERAVANIGGDLYIVGEPAEGSAWEIGLEDPLQPSFDLSVLHVQAPIAVATSSIIKRRWQQGQQARHHIIDPRSGEPAATDWLSATAIAPHGAQAEAFAKALLIAGSKDAAQVALGLPGLTYIGVDAQKALWGDPHSTEFLYATQKI